MKGTVGFLVSLLLFLAVIYAGISWQLRRTVLNPDFAAAQVEQADPVRAVKSMLLEQLDATAGPALMPVIDATLADQRDWLLSELRQAATALQDYLRGDAGRIQIRLDPEPVRKAFLASVETTLRTNVPPEVQRLGESERVLLESGARQAANAVFDRIGALTFDSDQASAETQAQLLTVRRQVGLFSRSTIVVLCAIVALGFIAGLLGQLHQAGVAAIVAGAVLILPTFVAARLVGFLPLPSLDDMPGVVAAYLPTFSEGLFAPLRGPAIAALVVGFGMVAIWFVLPKPRRGARRP